MAVLRDVELTPATGTGVCLERACLTNVVAQTAALVDSDEKRRETAVDDGVGHVVERQARSTSSGVASTRSANGGSPTGTASICARATARGRHSRCDASPTSSPAMRTVTFVDFPRDADRP